MPWLVVKEFCEVANLVDEDCEDVESFPPKACWYIVRTMMSEQQI